MTEEPLQMIAMINGEERQYDLCVRVEDEVPEELLWGFEYIGTGTQYKIDDMFQDTIGTYKFYRLKL